MNACTKRNSSVSTAGAAAPPLLSSDGSARIFEGQGPRVAYADDMSRECWCGRAKPEQHHFCAYCWRKLPRDDRAELSEYSGKRDKPGYQHLYVTSVAK